MAYFQFSLVKQSVFLFSVVAVFSVILFGGSFFYKQEQLDEERAIKGKMRSMQARISNIAHDKELVNTYQGVYKRLVDKGFLSNESRLSWMEQLERTAGRLALPDLQYQVDSQSEIKQDQYPIPHGVSLFKSQLTFETSLLHEGDLLELIADLQILPSGLLVVQHCDLSRTNTTMDNSEKGSNLNFKFHTLCDVSWYTTGEIAVPDLPSNSEA